MWQLNFFPFVFILHCLSQTPSVRSFVLSSSFRLKMKTDEKGFVKLRNFSTVSFKTKIKTFIFFFRFTLDNCQTVVLFFSLYSPRDAGSRSVAENYSRWHLPSLKNMFNLHCTYVE